MLTNLSYSVKYRLAPHLHLQPYMVLFSVMFSCDVTLPHAVDIAVSVAGYGAGIALLDKQCLLY